MSTMEIMRKKTQLNAKALGYCSFGTAGREETLKYRCLCAHVSWYLGLSHAVGVSILPDICSECIGFVILAKMCSNYSLQSFVHFVLFNLSATLL